MSTPIKLRAQVLPASSKRLIPLKNGKQFSPVRSFNIDADMSSQDKSSHHHKSPSSPCMRSPQQIRSPCALRIKSRQHSNTSPINASKNDSSKFDAKLQCAPLKRNWQGVKDQNVYLSDRRIILNPEMTEIMRPLNLDEVAYKKMDNKQGLFESPSMRLRDNTNHKTMQEDSTIFNGDKKADLALNIQASKFLFKDMEDSEEAGTDREQAKDSILMSDSSDNVEQYPMEAISDFETGLRRFECPDQQFKQSEIFMPTMKIDCLYTTLDHQLNASLSDRLMSSNIKLEQGLVNTDVPAMNIR